MRSEHYENFPLQFITHHNEKYGYLEGAKLALEGGCKWIQLRMKDASDNEVEEIAKELKPLCMQNGATFIIDDRVELVEKIGADGVHLGKNDMKPSDARKILGSSFIIGGTCNTFEDIVAIKDDVDYIGCGPYRYTTTKQGLAPILGIEGYLDLTWKCRSNGINIPIVAIGGITKKDIIKILESGPNGIAISGTILNAEDPVKETDEILRILYSSPFVNFMGKIADCGL